MTVFLGCLLVFSVGVNVLQGWWAYRLMNRVASPPGSRAYLTEQAVKLAATGPDGAKVANSLANAAAGVPRREDQVVEP